MKEKQDLTLTAAHLFHYAKDLGKTKRNRVFCGCPSTCFSIMQKIYVKQKETLSSVGIKIHADNKAKT